MTCAKRRVRCTIVAQDGRAVTGENECRRPQAVCPREPGEGYDKCVTVCDQVGHAEEVALDKARAAGLYLVAAVVVIAGHERVCEPCRQSLNAAWVGDIHMGKSWI